MQQSCSDLTPDEKVGEPMERDPWGELEPEEGT